MRSRRRSKALSTAWWIAETSNGLVMKSNAPLRRASTAVPMSITPVTIITAVSGSFFFYLRSFFKGAFFNQGLPTSIGGDGLVNALYSLKEGYLRSPSLRWLFHRDAVKQIRLLKDGTTVVLGGLIQTQKAENHNKIPLIGDIPLLAQHYLDEFRKQSAKQVTGFSEQGLQVLRTRPADATQWSGPYLAKDIPLDPWGRPYVYHYPGQHSEDPEIISYGADGQPGGEGINADIVSWQ